MATCLYRLVMQQTHLIVPVSMRHIEVVSIGDDSF